MSAPPLSPGRKQPSHELHALLDAELAGADKVALLKRLQHDHYSRNQLCELRNIKDLVKTAYDSRPVPHSLEPAQAKGSLSVRVWAFAIAASLLLIFGDLAGKLLQPDRQRMVLLDPNGTGQRPAQAGDEALRIVFHVAHNDSDASNEVLGEIEQMLMRYEKSGQPLRIEVVAHGKGLALLQEKLSQQRDQIASLAKRFPNLTFVACLNTTKRIEDETGIVVNLIPQAIPVESGVAYVIRRQQEGWIYIQV